MGSPENSPERSSESEEEDKDLETVAKVAGVVAGIAMVGWGISSLVSWATSSENSNEDGKKMKAPGKKDECIYRDDFEENPKKYFQGLRKKQCEMGTIKILSYNVWFREDLEMYNRMEAIGDLIQLHSPDVICLQEVTPDIYGLFQQSNWWKSYKCSLSYDTAVTRRYFCMQLSKLPVKSFSRKPFRYSSMGRELCVTEVAYQGDVPLVVATSHLESPCPGTQMYSKERVDQANEAVNFLKKYPNVIFCGDMNWDDELDGQFPLGEGWIDAWKKLRPNEDGWTYDTQSNKMLFGNWKLQKRLDRFLCNLRDFKVNGIEMIGMEAIPGLSYHKVIKGGRSLELPVLPSDHYGLLLTICAPSTEDRKKMKAPGKKDEYIYRDDFEKDPRTYYQNLRKK